MTVEITYEMQAARILLFGYVFYHVYLHYDQVICKSSAYVFHGLWILENKSFYCLQADKNFTRLCLE